MNSPVQYKQLGAGPAKYQQYGRREVEPFTLIPLTPWSPHDAIAGKSANRGNDQQQQQLVSSHNDAFDAIQCRYKCLTITGGPYHSAIPIIQDVGWLT